MIAGSTNRTVRGRPDVAKLIDVHGNDAPAGVPGELCLRVDTLFKGYWISPGVIDDPKRDGWFRTGDILQPINEGDFHYVARSKDIIVVNGENIAPAEIEENLRKPPAAADAAVTGIPHKTLGETIVGFIKLAKGFEQVTPDEILTWLSVRLASNK